MKKVSLILWLFSVGAAYGQKQYLVEYDRIKNTEKYYQLVNAKGKSNEVPVDKPNLKKGDMVKFRVVNMNPLVFTFDVKSEKRDPEENKYTSNVLSGFSDVVGRMGGAIGDVSRNLSNLTGWIATPSFTRGGAKVSEARKLSLEKLSNFHTGLKKSYTMLAQYQKAIQSVYSTELTKEEIVSQLKMASGTFNSAEYNAQLRKLEDEYKDLKKDTIIYENERYEIDSAYNTLIEDIETTWASPNKADELLSIIEGATFTAEKTMVIGYEESSWGGGELEDLDDAGYMNYTIHLKNLEKEDRDYKDDNILQNHDIQLSVQSPSNFSWATGLIFVSPFKGYNNYAVEEVGNDSLRVISGTPAPSMKFSVGTSLLYNFPSKGVVLPHALFGASVGLSADSWDKPVNFLLGGGLRIKQFPYVSFSAGVSFCQNTKLKNGFELGKTSLEPFSGDAVNDVTEKTFSPGYFFGININL